jgi:hypothetical protein
MNGENWITHGLKLFYLLNYDVRSIVPFFLHVLYIMAKYKYCMHVLYTEQNQTNALFL